MESEIIPVTRANGILISLVVPFGLPEEEALKSITLYPAQILGVSDKLESIEEGKDATLIVTDGNIFEIKQIV